MTTERGDPIAHPPAHCSLESRPSRGGIVIVHTDGYPPQLPQIHAAPIPLGLLIARPTVDQSHESVPVAVLEVATPANIDPDGYLWFNNDVAEVARSSPDADFARHHMESFGVNEQRRQLTSTSLPLIAASRTSKLSTLLGRSPGSKDMLETQTDVICGYQMESLRIKGDSRLPVPFERVSSHSYDQQTEAWFDDNPTSLFLDLGAGLRSVYRPNVVNVEIAMLPTTDILAFGDALPFDDDTFDGIVCLAVLEHVPDPFAVAREMVRIVRPGSRLVIDWPFLQPVHGYPHHYFNATEEGARDAFERISDVASVESFVPPWLHPVWTLRWFLGEWLERLPEIERQGFRDLSVAEVLEIDTASLPDHPWSTALTADHWSTISAGTRLTVTKRS